LTQPVLISGGQTGVDRAVLDAAIKHGIECGGYCPRGRWAEDGRISNHYPLLELEDSDPAARTRANVEDSEASVIFFRSELTGGSHLAADTARSAGKPLLLVDLADTSDAAALQLLEQFVRRHQPGSLNVAGPRASEWTAAYSRVRRIMDRWLKAAD